jgi:hypothetical protein
MCALPVVFLSSLLFPFHPSIRIVPLVYFAALRLQMEEVQTTANDMVMLLITPLAHIFDLLFFFISDLLILEKAASREVCVGLRLRPRLVPVPSPVCLSFCRCLRLCL